MSSQTDGRYTDKVRLVPWDAADGGHFQRMYDQRVACGWRKDEVGEWRDKMARGTKMLYWIVLVEEWPQRETALAAHLERYPNESSPLTDTAATVFNAPREPTQTPFVPVGHIALELLPDRNAEFSLPASTVWVMSLYVSWAIQASGIGRAAMARAEALGAAPPLRAAAVALDTVSGDFQGSEAALRVFYDDMGAGRPKGLRSSEEWYRRQGYAVVARREAGYVYEQPVTGERVPVPLVFMSKGMA